MRVLIVKLWALGDILMATPILSSLKRQFPGCSITWVADSQYASILYKNPYLDEVISFDTGAWRRQLRRLDLAGYWKSSQGLRRSLLEHRFDIVINMVPEKWWSIWFMAAPLRVGLFSQDRPNWMRRFFTHVLPRHPPGMPSRHNTEHYLTSVRALGCDEPDRAMSIGETDEDGGYADRFWHEHGFSTELPTVALAPFSTADNRVWQSDRLASLADQLSLELGAQIVLIGPQKQLETAREIIGMAKQARIALATDTSIREYVGLLRKADLVVCGDSSPMHICGALGKSYIALFGATPHSERAPLTGTGISLYKPIHCSPCDSNVCRNRVFRECMKQITVDDVMDAARGLLAKATPYAIPGGATNGKPT